MKLIWDQCETNLTKWKKQREINMKVNEINSKSMWDELDEMKKKQYEINMKINEINLILMWNEFDEIKKTTWN